MARDDHRDRRRGQPGRCYDSSQLSRGLNPSKRNIRGRWEGAMTDGKLPRDLYLALAGNSSCRARVRAFILGLAGLLALVWGPVTPAGASDAWQPIPLAELELKDDPINPGAHAVVLYREVFSNHKKKFDTQHVRIKILTEKGHDYANIKIPEVKGMFRVENISARTVQPDGRVIPFRGTVFEDTMVKARGVKVFVKAFTLPEVSVGSIVEYRYEVRWKSRTALPWFIQGTLSLLRGRFSARPAEAGLGHHVQGLPSGVRPVPQEDGTHLLEVEEIPAFVQEEHSPPEEDLKGRVMMTYPNDHPWLGWYAQVLSEFMGKHKKDISRVARAQVLPEDSPEAKLRKLYTRVQEVRNLAFAKTSGDGQRGEKIKDNRNVRDVLRRGYGYPRDINLLFVALARAAGFNATPVFVWHRDQTLLRAGVRQPDSIIVSLVLGTKIRYFDSATPGAAFGLLPWEKTDCRAGGYVFLGPEQTSVPVSADAVIARKAELRVTEDGTLEGHVKVSFHRQEALQRRLAGMMLDESARQAEFEKEAKAWFPSETEIGAIEVKNWEDPEAPIELHFEVTIPDFAVSAGRRLLLSSGIFQTQRKQLFQNARRVHPVYFRYPWQEIDEVVLELPAGYAIDGLPAPQRVSNDFGLFETSYEQDENGLRLKRQLVVEGFFSPLKSYPALKDFFAKVKGGDDDQVVLAKRNSNP